MIKRVTSATIALVVLAWHTVGLAQNCVQDGVAAHGFHTCAFALGGSAMCWGDNSSGELGNGGIGDSNVPVPAAVVGVVPTAIVAGWGHSCALSGPGTTAVCWGSDKTGQLGDGQDAQHCSRVQRDFDCPSATPVLVTTAGGVELSNVRTLAAGDSFTCALSNAGNVQCWGNNSAGQLGDGQDANSEPSRANPHDLVSSILDTGAVAITAGASHACALVHDQTARCWGDNENGQLGIGAAPTAVSHAVIVTTAQGSPLAPVEAIVAGPGHTCALMSGGTVQCWGLNDFGQLGRNTTSCPGGQALPLQSDVPCSVPQPVLDQSNNPIGGVVEIALGVDHTCALTTAGTVRCWGLNNSGQLGAAIVVGNDSASVSPVTVAVSNCSPDTDPNCTPLSGAVHISAGWEHACVTLSAGGMRCWGLNGSGQLGLSTGSAFRIPVPVMVAGLCDCPGPIAYCNGQCVDTTADPDNCGGCNVPCAGGACCSGECKDTTADPANCGGCNNLCFAGEQCMASMCRCAGTLCAAPGPTQICTNLMSDPKNCLQCGHICPRGAVCSSSGCICPAGLTECRGGCVDLQFDNNNCGRCGVRCRATPPCNREENGCTTCENGECVPF
jgi:alpha-tubulin suppressor-like RCC1 family protein